MRFRKKFERPVQAFREESGGTLIVLEALKPSSRPGSARSLQNNAGSRRKRNIMKQNKVKRNTSGPIAGILALSLALPFAVATGYAQTSQPSAKVTAKVSNVTLVNWTDAATTGWQTLLENTIKTANQK